MFRKRNNVVKKVDLNKQAEEIQIKEEQQESKPLPKSVRSKKINNFFTNSKYNEMKQRNSPGRQESVLVRNNAQQSQEGVKQKQKVEKCQILYGLIQKQHIKPQHPQISSNWKQKDENPLLKMYINKRKNQMEGKKEPVEEDYGYEIRRMEKQYLKSNENKIEEYNSVEVRKKLETMANNAIRSELEARQNYLKDLLQNQYERMEYASQKELKMIRQEKERTQKQLFSKYKSEGRRHFVESIKTYALKNL